jgi:hypothetical protein
MVTAADAGVEPMRCEFRFILLPPGPTFEEPTFEEPTFEDWEHMRRHALIRHDSPRESALPDPGFGAERGHGHDDDRPDGSGYPPGLTAGPADARVRSSVYCPAPLAAACGRART